MVASIQRLFTRIEEDPIHLGTFWIKWFAYTWKSHMWLKFGLSFSWYPSFYYQILKRIFFFLLSLSTKLSQDPFSWMGLVLIHLSALWGTFLLDFSPWAGSVLSLECGYAFKMETPAWFPSCLQSEYLEFPFIPRSQFSISFGLLYLSSILARSGICLWRF